MKFTTSTTVGLALLMAACNQSPTAPSRTFTPSNQPGPFGLVTRTKAIEMARAGANWLQLGRVTFTSDEDAYYLFVDWDAYDYDNQVPRKWNTAFVKAGDVGDISMYVPDPQPWHCDQQDLYKIAAGVPSGTPDMSILRNYLWAANQDLLPKGCVPHKTTPPTDPPPLCVGAATLCGPPGPPPPFIPEPPCSEDKIESVSSSHDAAMTVETVTAVVKKGLSGFRLFLNSFGLWAQFAHGLVPMPQDRPYVTEYVTHEGVNVFTVPIVSHVTYKAFQSECGCQKAPNPITTAVYGVEFTWFTHGCSDGANFGPQEDE